MNIKHKNIIICCICLILNSLGFSQYSELALQLSSAGILPSLNIETNIENIAKAYQNNHLVSSTNFQNNNNSVGLIQSSTYYSDIKINDAEYLFKKFLNSVIADNEGKNGSIIIDLVFYDYSTSSSIGMIPNILTFGLTSLFGVPGTKNRTSVEVELKIFNSMGTLVANYYGNGKDVYRKGIYTSKTQRHSNIEAIKSAIYNLNDQLLADLNSINELLK